MHSDNNFSSLFYLGLNYQNIPDLPSNIDIGCHNSEDNVTLSGPSKDMENYLEILKKRNVFVRTVNSNGIAYHSRLVRKQAEFVQKFIEKVIFNYGNSIFHIPINYILKVKLIFRLYQNQRNDLQNGYQLQYQKKIGIPI